MSGRRECTYVAQGFRADAEKLLVKFEAMESLKFSDFAQIWRDLRFSLIYMGRLCLKELKEFTEECFRNTLMFLDLRRPYIKVGTIYLLYSLYLKEPIILLGNPVKIAITIKQVEDIQQLEDFFIGGEYGETHWELSYVINKLFKMEAFHISHSSMTYGPLVPYSLLQLPPIIKSEFLNSLEDLNVIYNAHVKDLVGMMEKYQQIKSMIPVPNSNDICEADLEKLKQLSLGIEKYKERYDAGLPLEEVSINNSQSSITASKEISVGARRILLKSQQYERPAVPDCNVSRTPLPDKYESYIANCQLKRLRRNGIKRKPGRPKNVIVAEYPSTNEKGLGESFDSETIGSRRQGLRAKICTDVKYSVSENDDADNPSDPDFDMEKEMKETRKRGRSPKIPKVEKDSSHNEEESQILPSPGKEKRKRGRPRIHFNVELRRTENRGKRRAPKPRRTHFYEE